MALRSTSISLQAERLGLRAAIQRSMGSAWPAVPFDCPVTGYDALIQPQKSVEEPKFKSIASFSTVLI